MFGPRGTSMGAEGLRHPGGTPLDDKARVVRADRGAATT